MFPFLKVDVRVKKGILKKVRTFTIVFTGLTSIFSVHLSNQKERKTLSLTKVGSPLSGHSLYWEKESRLDTSKDKYARTSGRALWVDYMDRTPTSTLYRSREISRFSL